MRPEAGQDRAEARTHHPLPTAHLDEILDELEVFGVVSVVQRLAAGRATVGGYFDEPAADADGPHRAVLKRKSKIGVIDAKYPPFIDAWCTSWCSTIFVMLLNGKNGRWNAE